MNGFVLRERASGLFVDRWETLHSELAQAHVFPSAEEADFYRLNRLSQPDLPESRRKELFHLLVVAQDYAMSVAEAREMACDLFGLMETQVVQIEEEGLESDWPPCDVSWGVSWSSNVALQYRRQLQ